MQRDKHSATYRGIAQRTALFAFICGHLRYLLSQVVKTHSAARLRSGVHPLMCARGQEGRFNADERRCPPMNANGSELAARNAQSPPD